MLENKYYFLLTYGTEWNKNELKLIGFWSSYIVIDYEYFVIWAFKKSLRTSKHIATRGGPWVFYTPQDLPKMLSGRIINKENHLTIGVKIQENDEENPHRDSNEL